MQLPIFFGTAWSDKKYCLFTFVFSIDNSCVEASIETISIVFTNKSLSLKPRHVLFPNPNHDSYYASQQEINA